MNSASEIICSLLKRHFRKASEKDIEELAVRLQNGLPAAVPLDEGSAAFLSGRTNQKHLEAGSG